MWAWNYVVGETNDKVGETNDKVGGLVDSDEVEQASSSSSLDPSKLLLMQSAKEPHDSQPVPTSSHAFSDDSSDTDDNDVEEEEDDEATFANESSVEPSTISDDGSSFGAMPDPLQPNDPGSDGSQRGADVPKSDDSEMNQHDEEADVIVQAQQPGNGHCTDKDSKEFMETEAPTVSIDDHDSGFNEDNMDPAESQSPRSVDSDALGIDEDGEVVVTEEFPLADSFLVDDGSVFDTLSVYQSIADTNEETLLEAFRALETDETDSNTVKQDEAVDPSHLMKKNRSVKVVRKQSDENQALFDIMDRDFEAVTTQVSIGHVALTPDDLQLCFATFVACFTPPPKTHYSVEYNHNIDETIARAKEQEADGEVSDNDTRSQNSRTSRQTAVPERGTSESNAHFPRPYVPLHIVNALWSEVVSYRLSNAPDTQDSVVVPTSVLSFIRDSLVLLGVLDVRKVSGQSSGHTSARDSSESVLSVNEPSSGLSSQSTEGAFVEVVSVHQNIHQEYGQYLLSEHHPSGYRSFLDGCAMRAHRAITRECSCDPGDITDAGYLVQLLPWNMISAGEYRAAAVLLSTKQFVYRRLQVLGVLGGVTAQVTDVEELLYHVHMDTNPDMTVPASNTAMIESYEQMKKSLIRHTTDLGDTTGSVTSSINLRVSQTAQMQLDMGRALHMMGASFGAQGYSTEALSMYDEALRLKKTAEIESGTLTVTISDTIHCKGFAFDTSGRYLQAMDCYNEALQLRRAALGGDDLRVAETLHNKGAILCETSSCDAALSCLEEALSIRQSCLGDIHELCADTQQWIGNVMREWGRYDDAIVHFKTALQIKKTTLGHDHEDVANTLQNMAIVLDEMSRYTSSLACYNEALKIYSLYHGRHSLPIADTLQCIANVYAVTEEHQKALDVFTEVVNIRESVYAIEAEAVDDRSYTVQALIATSDDDNDDNSLRFGKLLNCYEEVLPLTKLLKDANDESLATILRRMGDIYWKLHDWDNSIGSLQGALRIRRALSVNVESIKDEEICDLLEKKGTAHLFRKEFERAKSCFESIVHRRKKNAEMDGPGIAFTVYCLGVAIHHLRTHELARLAFTEALRLWKKQYGEGHVLCGHALYWLGVQESELGNHNQALRVFRGALHNYKLNKSDICYRVVGETLRQLGCTHEKLEDSGMALKSLNEAARLLRWHASDDEESLVWLLCRVGALYESELDRPRAMDSYSQAIDVLKQHGVHDILLCSTTQKLGVLQYKEGLHSAAKDTLSEAYRLYESIVGPTDLRTANAVYQLGQVLDTLKSYDAAMQCYRECLRVQKMTLDVETGDVARTLVSMGVNLYRQQKSKEATECLQQALSMQRAVFGDSSDEVASTLHNLAQAYTGAGSFDKAVVCYKEAARITRISNPESAELPEILFNMASAEEKNGNFEGAIASYSRTLSAWHKTQVERVPSVMLRLGAAYDKQGDYQQAVDILSQARQRLAQGDSRDQLTDVQAALARNYASLGQNVAAIEEYNALVDMLKDGRSDNLEKLSDAFYALGTLQTRVGALKSAILSFQECLSVRKAFNDENDERVARVLVNLSVVSEKLEDFVLADTYMDQAIAIFNSVGNEKEVAALLQSQGRVLGKIGNHEKAVDCIEGALAIRRRLFGSNDVQVGMLLQSCALAWFDSGDLLRAMSCARDSWRIRKLKIGADSAEAAEAQFLLGRILLSSGDFNGAIENIRDALTIYQERLDPGCREVGDCYHFLGCAYASSQNHKSATVCLVDALSIRSRFCGGESIEVADTCFHLGQSLCLEGNTTKALEAAVQALRIRKLKAGNESLQCAQTLRLLGSIQEALGKSSEALNCHVEALRVFTVVQGKDHSDVAGTLLKIGSLYLKTYEYNKAMDNLKRALKIYKEKPDDHIRDVASVLLVMGNVEFRRGRGDLAIENYKQGLHISKQLNDKSGLAAALYEIGLVVESQGDNGEALECYQEVFKLAETGEETTANAHNRVGGIEAELEDYDAALGSFDSALSIFKKLHGDESVEVARTVHNIAGVYEARLEFDNAYSSYSDALRMYKAKLESDDLVIAGVLSDLGINCARRKDYAKAIELCSDVLRIRRLKLGAKHLDTCDAVYNIANVLDEWGKVDQAMKFYTEALQLYRSELGHDDVEVANCFQYIGMLHFKKGEDDFAVRALVEALRIYKVANEESVGVASIHFGLGQIHLKRSECNQALESFSHCYRIRKRELGDQHMEVGAVCEQIGAVYAAKNTESESRAFYEKALQVFAESSGKSSIHYSRVLASTATLLAREESGYDSALIDYRHCLDVYRREFGEESDEVADILVKIGVIHNKRVDYEEAMKELTAALKIRSTMFGRDDERVGRTLFEIGCVLEEWGDSEEALDTYREVLRIIKLNFGQEHEILSKVYNRVGRVHMENADYDAALRAFNSALEADRRLRGDDAAELGHTLINIGALHDAREEADHALTSYSQALKIFRNKLGQDDVAVALALNNIGINYARRRNNSKAIELCSEAMRIRKLALGSDHLDVADSYLNIANILDEWGKDEQALKFYQEAMGLYRRRLGDDDSEVANCLQHVGSMHIKLNNQGKAITCFVESIRIYRIHGAHDTLDVALSLFNLGRIYGKRGEYEKSLACFKECLRIRREALGDQNMDVIAVHRYMDAIKRKMRR